MSDEPSIPFHIAIEIACRCNLIVTHKATPSRHLTPGEIFSFVEEARNWANNECPSASEKQLSEDSMRPDSTDKSNQESQKPTKVAFSLTAFNISLKKLWIVDCGASGHMASDASSFWQLKCSQKHQHVSVGNGDQVEVLGIGTRVLKLTIKGEGIVELRLNEVAYVPQLTTNIISIGKATREGRWLTRVQKSVFELGDLRAVERVRRLVCGLSFCYAREHNKVHQSVNGLKLGQVPVAPVLHPALANCSHSLIVRPPVAAPSTSG